MIKFTEIDLKQPLQPIYVDSPYDWLFVVAKWGYQPIGLMKLYCQASKRTLSAEDIKRKALETFGWQLWEQALAGKLDKLEKPSDSSLPAISVIVCTRDRPLSLHRCLEALKGLDYPVYEVIVVDNCSRDETVAQVITESGFRYVRENRPGLDWARNRGLKEAKHDIVAYVDDDALVTPGWLRGIALGFEKPEIMAVTGMVLPSEVETPAQNDFERYGGMSKGFIPYTVELKKLDNQTRYWSSNWGVGANMAFRRILFEKIGVFDVALDVGTPTNGAGDIEFFYRVVSAGHVLRYEPAAMIYHVHRRDGASLRQQIYNNGRSFMAYLLTIARNEPERRLAVGWFAFRWWIIDWLLRRLFIGIIKRDRETISLAITELSGFSSSFWAYRTAQKLATRQLAAN